MPSKNDKKDALVIADMVKNGITRSFATHRKPLKNYVSFSQTVTVVRRLVSAKNQIHRGVDDVFPELRFVFENIMCTGSLATLRLFPTPEVLYKLKPRDVIQGWKSLMKRHSGKPIARALIL